MHNPGADVAAASDVAAVSGVAGGMLLPPLLLWGPGIAVAAAAAAVAVRCCCRCRRRCCAASRWPLLQSFNGQQIVSVYHKMLQFPALLCLLFCIFANLFLA